MKPLILINFKAYSEVSGEKALQIARQLTKVKSRKYQVALAPPLLSLKEISKSVSLPIFSQHTDPFGFGAHTGSIPLAELKVSGISGTLLNHSEKKIPFSLLKETVALCKAYQLITVVCASSLAEVKKVAFLKPDYLAYEPPELIGGDISVTSAKPEIITRTVHAVRKISSHIQVLCGAGVHNREDVQKALELGASGVLIAHAVVQAKKPKEFVEILLS